MNSFLNRIPLGECRREHRWPAGPNEDIGVCPECWTPIGVLRPEGESFGWHTDDCSLPLRHPGECEGAGAGHVLPPGTKIRGYWPHDPRSPDYRGA